jgi:LacI family transcriptional regulator
LVVSEISNPFFSEIYRVVEEVALGAGKVVLVCNTNELCERENLVLRALRAQRIAGLVIAPAGQGNEYGIELASRIPHRTVVIDRHIPFLERDFVCLDNRAAGRMITEYLLRLGHRRIGFIGGREGVSTAVERFEGFAGALRDGGATLDPSLCIDANYRSELANRAAVEMLTRTDRPSAIVAANNLTTLGVMQAVSALGFDCPNDVSVGGIDDSPWNIALRPPLTSIAQPIQAIGRQAIDWLIERLSNPVDIAPRSVAFAPALVIRDSCSAV